MPEKQITIADLPESERDKIYGLINLTRQMSMNSPAVNAKFDDQTDADDWLFSELGFTKSDLQAIYDGKPDFIYTGSAVD